MEKRFSPLLILAVALASLGANQAIADDYFATGEVDTSLTPGPDAAVCPPVVAADCCCTPPWAHRTGVFAEFLEIRARDAAVAFAETTDGPAVQLPGGVAPVQFGTLTVADPDYSPAYRVGGSFAFDCSSSVAVAYTHFETDTDIAASTDPTTPFVIQPLVLHPVTFNTLAPGFALDTGATYGIEYDLVDLDYRGVFWSNCTSAINYTFGLRYARLQQTFGAFFGGVGNDVFAFTDTTFEGGGLRVGLDAERYSNHGLMFYSKGMANFIAGEFRGRYISNTATDPSVINLNWAEGRTAAILEFELGVGWVSRSGRLRASTGYMINAWYNMVTTDEFIQSAITNNFVDLGNLMTFDGFVVHLEYNF